MIDEPQGVSQAEARHAFVGAPGVVLCASGNIWEIPLVEPMHTPTAACLEKSSSCHGTHGISAKTIGQPLSTGVIILPTQTMPVLQGKSLKITIHFALFDPPPNLVI